MSQFELEQELPRTEIAAYLRQLADGFETGDKVTFVSGEESATVNPGENIHFHLTAKDDNSWLGGDRGRSLLVKLGWEHQEDELDDGLSIVLQPDKTRRTDDHQQTTPSR